MTETNHVQDDQRLERQLRYQLGKRGWRLEKTPARSWLRYHYGVGYQVTENNVVKFGCSSRQYEASLAEVRDFAEHSLEVTLA